VLLYSGSEIPVLGGQVRVEVCFGRGRQVSAWKMGKNGVFKWNEKLAPLTIYGSLDKDQLPHVIVNVYHRVGASTRKIAFERIHVDALWPGQIPYELYGGERMGADPSASTSGVKSGAGAGAGGGLAALQSAVSAMKPTEETKKPASAQGSSSASASAASEIDDDGDALGLGGVSQDEPPQQRMRYRGPIADGFYVNGERMSGSLRSAGASAWPTRWRKLSHVYSDPEQAHVVAGFLLCSIGFGLKDCMPDSIPEPVKHKSQTHVLRATILHGANLPAADESGTSNPVVVVRFGGESTKPLPAKQDTLFPYWCVQRAVCCSLRLFHRYAAVCVRAGTSVSRCVPLSTRSTLRRCT
jgi:hypothetical protein